MGPALLWFVFAYIVEYLPLLSFHFKKFFNLISGGSILNEIWVVTAGHCYDNDLKDLKVVAGAHDLREKNGNEQTRDVETFIQHPDYPGGTAPNDISLLKVAAAFEL